MPVHFCLSLTVPSLLFFGVTMLAAQEAETRFVIPEQQAQVSFGPVDVAIPATPQPKRELTQLAKGFESTATFPVKPPQETPVRQVSFESSADSAPSPSSGKIAENAAEIPAEDSHTGTSKGEILLDKPLSFSKGTSGKGKMERPTFSGGLAPLFSVAGSLLIVLSAFLLLVFLFKKVSPKSGRLLPKEAFEDLGRTFLTPKLQLHLLRLGNRLILVSITPDGISPITEVTDPDEVVPLLGLCRRQDMNSSSELFRKTLSDYTATEGENGYFGASVVSRSKKNPSASKSKSKTTDPSLVDLYSEPGESLAEMLASAKGGRNG